MLRNLPVDLNFNLGAIHKNRWNILGEGERGVSNFDVERYKKVEGVVVRGGVSKMAPKNPTSFTDGLLGKVILGPPTMSSITIQNLLLRSGSN